MKLKSMYTCISKVPDSDSPYEAADPKTFQAKKTVKPNKRNALRLKGQPLSKSPKTPLSTLTKIPSDSVISPSKTSVLCSKKIKKRSFSTKEQNASSEADSVNNNMQSKIESSRKFSTDFSLVLHSTSNASMGFEANNDAKKLLTPKMENCDPARSPRASPFESEDKETDKSFFLNSDNFEDLNSSHDDVFTGTDTPSWIIGEEEWKSESFSTNNVADDKEMKLNKSSIEDFGHQLTSCSVPLSPTKRDGAGNVSTRKTRNCGGVSGSQSPRPPVSRTDNLSSLSFERQITTSVDRATDSFETLRNLCANERLPRGHSFQQRSVSSTAVAPPPRRAFSTSPTTIVRDVPPLIPPREPIRSSHAIPHRHASSPSNSCTLGSCPSFPVKSKTRFSVSAQNEASRPKYRTQPSTTPVFSAMPPSLTRSNPIIRPIMKDGMQTSHTHYYLLGEDESSSSEKKKSKPKKYDPLIGIPRPVPKCKTLSLDRSNRLPPPRPPPPPASFYASQYSSEHDDLERACSLPLPDQMSALSSRKLSHSRLSPSLSSPHEGLESEKTMTVSRKMSSGEMINVLQSQVFGVTTEECQKALSRNEWNIAKSLNYLKIEQLFRVGLTTRENCQALLQTAKWDLQSASQLLLDQHYRSQKTRS